MDCQHRLEDDLCSRSLALYSWDDALYCRTVVACLIVPEVDGLAYTEEVTTALRVALVRDATRLPLAAWQVP